MGMVDYKPPAAPPDLREPGREAWSKLTHAFEFHAGEIVVLEQLCRTVDLIAAMDAELAANGIMIKGSRGQLVMSPLINQRAVQATLLDRLTLSLALPVDGEQVGRRRS